MYVTDKIKNLEWKLYRERKRRALKNDHFSIISSNCSGTVIYSDLHLPYTSPTEIGRASCRERVSGDV